MEPAPDEGDDEGGEAGPGEPPAGPPPEPDVGASSREPHRPDDDGGEPSLPGAGWALAAEALDGLGSRRVAWTLAGAALLLVGAAHWGGFVDAGWMLRVAFLLAPTLLLPAFLVRFPLERRTGQDRVVATYPQGRGRFLAGRFLAYLLLAVAYVLVALAVVGPLAYYAGPYWVDQLPTYVGMGLAVAAATAALGLLLGTLFGGVSSRGAGGLGLILGALLFLAPLGVARVETLLGGTGYDWIVVRLLHVSPATGAATYLVDPSIFPVAGPPGARAAALPLVGLVSLVLGALAYVRLQGPGGWSVHPVLRILFALVVVAGLASPVVLALDVADVEEPSHEDRSAPDDVTVRLVPDLRGASGETAVDGRLTQGVEYDGFLALEFEREGASSNLTLTDVSVDVRSEVLGVNASDELPDVTVPGSTRGDAEEPLDVPVTVRSVPGALDPGPVTAVVDVETTQADFTVARDDLRTATVGNDVVRWLPAAAAGGILVVEAAVLVAARRRL